MYIAWMGMFVDKNLIIMKNLKFVVDHFINKKRDDHIKSKTNFTVQAVIMHILSIICTGIWHPSAAAYGIGGKPEMLLNANASFFASLRVGGLKYFLTNLRCIAKTTLSTDVLIAFSDIPEAHEFCESRECPRNFHRVTFNISCFVKDFPFLLCPSI